MELKNLLESVGGVMVIVLDEIDRLVKKSGDETLYNLTRINSDLKDSKVSIIGISNDLQVHRLPGPEGPLLPLRGGAGLPSL